MWFIIEKTKKRVCTNKKCLNLQKIKFKKKQMNWRIYYQCTYCDTIVR